MNDVSSIFSFKLSWKFTVGLNGFGYGSPKLKILGFKVELSELNTGLKVILCMLNPAWTICILRNFSPSLIVTVWAGLEGYAAHLIIKNSKKRRN